MGGIVGAVTSQFLSSEILGKIIPILLCIVLLYSFVSPKLGNKDERPRMNEFWFYLLFGFGLDHNLPADDLNEALVEIVQFVS